MWGCLAKIPKIVHFCFGLSADFGFRPWSLVHYASVRSAYERIKPDAIFFYFEHEPKGPWWDITLPFIQPVKVAAPRTIFGRPLRLVQHRADVLRLEKLIEHGGIYLDSDIVVLRDFNDLLENDFVISEEGPGGSHGLSNAVLLSSPGATFAKRWYNKYSTFSDKNWTEYSVQLPKLLATDHPAEVTVLPHTSFAWPLHYRDHLKWIFESDRPVHEPAYTRHFWESLSWSKYLENLTPGEVRRANTNFGKWVAPLLSGLPDDYSKKTRSKIFYEKAQAFRSRLKERFRLLFSPRTI